MSSLFISRALEEDSVIRQFAKENNWSIVAESMIEIQTVLFPQIPKADWVFFYSKNAVQAFFQGLQHLGEKWETKIGVIGPGTLQALKPFGKSADFAGNGDPKQVAEAFAVLCEGQKVLFPRAQQSRKSIQTLLEDIIDVLDLVVYTNTPKVAIDIPETTYLLFTSPQNAQRYFMEYPDRIDQTMIAIGATTGQALIDLGVQQVHIATQASEHGMLEMLQFVLSEKEEA